MGRDTKRKLTLRKRHFFVMETDIEDARQKEKDVPLSAGREGERRKRSAGSDNEAHLSCKRRVTANFVQIESIWLQNHKNQGFNFLDSGNPMFSRRRPMPAFSLVSFKQ